MSNGKAWTNEEKTISSNEEATRAVSHDQFMSAIAQNHSRDNTRIAQAEVFPNQNPTKAIDAKQFYQAANSFEQDSNEDKTRALNTSDFNFQSPKSNQAFLNQQSQARPGQETQAYPSSSQAYPASSQAYPASAQAYPSPAQAYPSPAQAYPSPAQAYPPPAQSYPEPYSKPVTKEYPSPQPRRQDSAPVSTLQTPNIITNPNDNFNHFPPPLPKANAETPPQTQAIDQHQASVPIQPLAHELDSEPSFNREDLTQAHLKSQALAELITEHRYQEQPDNQSELPLSIQSSSQRIKRSKLIIYSSISLAILIIIIALSSTYFNATNSLINRIDQQNIPLIKLKAPYALALSKLVESRTQNQSPLNNTDILHVFYTKQKLLYTDHQGEFEHEVALDKKMLVPQVHPLRLNGSYFPKLIHQLESFWPTQDLKQLVLTSSPSISAGSVLDLISTLTINNERKGQRYERYNLLIEQKSNAQNADRTVKTNTPRKKANQRNLVMLPFKILFKNDDINRNEFLQISWSKTKKTVFIVGPKRRTRSRFKIPSQTLSHQEGRLANELKEKINQIGSLKGILITVPRSITLTELALWLSVSAPYPVYLIPPKASL